MRMPLRVIFVLLACLCNQGLFAADWSTTSVQLLSGKDYKAPGDTSYDQEILTFEHASGGWYGDNFFFADIEKTGSKSPSIYFEWAPRFSLGKLAGVELGGPIADVSVALQLNQASGFREIYLYGVGLDIKVPGTRFFQANLYQRDNLAADGTSIQLTLVWEAAFLNDKLTFGGFLDYATEEGDKKTYIAEANLLTQPQLLYWVHKDFGLGIEYQYWQNKLGIKDLNESVPQLMVKWVL